jgi:hypothetical protein
MEIKPERKVAAKRLLSSQPDSRRPKCLIARSHDGFGGEAFIFPTPKLGTQVGRESLSTNLDVSDAFVARYCLRSMQLRPCSLQTVKATHLRAKSVPSEWESLEEARNMTIAVKGLLQRGSKITSASTNLMPPKIAKRCCESGNGKCELNLNRKEQCWIEVQNRKLAPRERVDSCRRVCPALFTQSSDMVGLETNWESQCGGVFLCLDLYFAKLCDRTQSTSEGGPSRSYPLTRRLPLDKDELLEGIRIVRIV